MRTVDAATLKQWLDRGEAVLVDVREPAEFASEHIAGATLLPLASVAPEALPATGDRKLVICCRSGKRGGMACERLAGSDVYNLSGGVQAWMEAGLPVELGTRTLLPLDRQVQLTIGTVVLASTLLGYFVHPGFLLLSAFFGAGLCFAGLTGFCGLALLMAKAPWNRGSGSAGATCRAG